MATKAKGKAKAVSSQPAAVSQAGAPELAVAAKGPIDALDLEHELRLMIEEFIDETGRELGEDVERLRRELCEAELKFERHMRPLRAVERLTRSATEAPAKESYDDGLLKAIAVVKLTHNQYDPVANRVREVPSGARPWVELILNGASDATITTNLKHVDNEHGAAWKIDTYSLELEKKRSGWQYDKILKGPPLVQAVRRVLGIPLPGKAASVEPPAVSQKTAKKKAAVKRSRKKAAKRKAPKGAAKGGPVAKPVAAAKKKPAAKAPAVKSEKKKYLSGAEKRRRKAEREAAANAAGAGPARAKAPAGAWYALAPGENEFRWRQRLLERMEELVADQAVDLELLPAATRAAVVGRRRESAKQAGEPACAECGCTNESPCPGGCMWVGHPEDPAKELCSACLPAVRERVRQAAAGSVMPGPTAAREAAGVVNSDEVPPAIAKRAARYKGPASKRVNGAVSHGL